MKQLPAVIIITLILLISACSKKSEDNIQNVGMLFSNEMSDHPWDLKGYEGLEAIGKQYGVDTFYKENIENKHEIIDAVDKFERNGVNLIFGHGHTYGRTFLEISEEFPNIHFVYLGGGYFNESVTSLNLDSHAMSFFAGMIASKMSQTEQVGIIANYEWQPEIEGFYEGVKYENPQVNVNIDIVNNWNEQSRALAMYEEIKLKGIDVIYPVGDMYSTNLIESAKKDGIYSIGYLVDAAESGQETILTSTIQHIDKVYEHAAEKFNRGMLEGGLLTFDFQEGFVSLGPFNDDVPKEYQKLIQELVLNYKETKRLPTEQ